MGVHWIHAGAMKIAHCGKILSLERNYSMVSSQGEKVGELIEQSPHQKGDFSFNPNPVCYPLYKDG